MNIFELTIGGQVYKFKFGMGFMREINKRMKMPVDGVPNAEKNVGLQYYIAGVLDGDVEFLIETLNIANKGFEPRITANILDGYIDDENTDIEKLFDDVVDFLEKANATKKVTAMLLAELERQKQQNQI